MDIRSDRLARLLTNYCVEVRPGDWVLIRADLLGLPLVEQVVEHVLVAGGHPTVQLLADTLDEVMLRYASDEQLSWLSPVDQMLAERVGCADHDPRTRQHAVAERRCPRTAAHPAKCTATDIADLYAARWPTALTAGRSPSFPARPMLKKPT